MQNLKGFLSYHQEPPTQNVMKYCLAIQILKQFLSLLFGFFAFFDFRRRRFMHFYLDFTKVRGLLGKPVHYHIVVAAVVIAVAVDVVESVAAVAPVALICRDSGRQELVCRPTRRNVNSSEGHSGRF